jgi:NADPH2:quinone reductase
MRAVVLDEFGPPEALSERDVPDLVPGPGQALVDVEFAGVTFVETQVRAGKAPHPAMAPHLPAIPGNGVGGFVTEVGPGVDPSLVGTRVVSTTGGSGGYAEQAVVDASLIIPVPEGVGLAGAVALLADGRTAVSLMCGARVQRGETVIVEAAAGGVGSLLVQLSHNAGGRVVALAGSEHKLEVARDLGADLTFDYTEPGWADQVRSVVGSVDVVFDGVGGSVGRSAFELLRSGGRMSSFGLAAGAFTEVNEHEAIKRGVTLLRGAGLTPETMRELSEAALRLAAGRRLRPVLGQSFPLGEAADAHAAIEARETVGKTLLVAAA